MIDFFSHTGSPDHSELYDVIFTDTTDVLSRLDKHLRHIYVSPSIEKVTGKNPAEFIGKTNHEMGMPSDLVQSWDSKMLEVFATGKPLVFTFSFGEGTHVRQFESRVIPEFSASGAVETIAVFARDCTREKRTTEKFDLLTRAIEQSPVSVVITDKRGAIEYVNSSFSRITGYGFAEVSGQNPRVLKSGQTPPETYTALWATIVQGRQWEGELINKKKNGELYTEYARISGVTDESGAITHFLAVKEDVTAQKKQQNELSETKLFLDHIVNAVADPIFVKDRKHCFKVMNDSMCAFMGKKREELLGKSDYDFFPKQEVDVFWAKDEEVFTTKKENENEEQFTDGAGILHTIATRKTYLVLPNGEELIVGVIRDITTIKSIEKTLRDKTQEYERMNSLMVDRELKMIELKKALAEAKASTK